MRSQIKQVATELLITHGVRGLRFGDIAERLGITRANIHYHFGTKRNLVEEAIEEYLDGTLGQLGAIWSDETLSYEEKARRTMEFNRTRYEKFNSRGTGGRPWSLISRMRLEADQLTPRSRAALQRFSEAIETHVNDAVLRAQAKGEIAADAPTRDVAVQLVAIVDSAGSITQDAASFDRLEHLYTAYVRIIGHAYGGKKAEPQRRSLAAVAKRS